MSQDSFESRATLTVGDREVDTLRLDALAGVGEVATLPHSIRVADSLMRAAALALSLATTGCFISHEAERFAAYGGGDADGASDVDASRVPDGGRERDSGDGDRMCMFRPDGSCTVIDPEEGCTVFSAAIVDADRGCLLVGVHSIECLPGDLDEPCIAGVHCYARTADDGAVVVFVATCNWPETNHFSSYVPCDDELADRARRNYGRRCL